MESVSIVLSKKISQVLNRKAEEVGLLPEELAFELVCKGLNEELDPEDLAEHYQILSSKYLQEGKELLNRGDLVQASEKLWGAAALAVKAVAAKRGFGLEKYGSLWQFVEVLTEESKDEEIIKVFHIANSLHRNFYENQMSQKTIKRAAEGIEDLIKKLQKME